MADKKGVSIRFLSLSLGRKLARILKALISPALYHGHARWCPVCEKHSRKFLRFGAGKREDARCPRCGSLERHRLAWLYFTRKTDLFAGASRKMLHIAPEPCLMPRFRRFLGDDYLSADVQDPAAMVRVDVTSLPFAGESFDVIFCSHVLEHVADDRKALREFFRVLKPKGWLVLLVPVSARRTLEDPTIVDGNERKRIFGQEDHVRRYGPDYVERVEQAGFTVKVVRPDDVCRTGEIGRMGLAAVMDEICRCDKA